MPVAESMFVRAPGEPARATMHARERSSAEREGGGEREREEVRGSSRAIRAVGGATDALLFCARHVVSCVFVKVLKAYCTTR